MEKIHIPGLEALPQHTVVLEIDEFLLGLDSLTPIQGQLQIIHQGNYLQVSTEAQAIVTLKCDRCLQQYNHRLTVEAAELIWLSPESDAAVEPNLEIEVTLDDPVETLSPQGYFDPQDWLYQQLSLQLPYRQLCDQNCEGLMEEIAQQVEQPLDRRWAALESLRTQLQHEI
ncbi:MAG: DUF177 domain-containing protein [Acaryochloris sp. CRU_2_0]|nr:DUF177 domain-containing protein [Acaryochloris sp. CRU_2_0]